MNATDAKVYERTENGTVTHVSIREGLAEVNHAMMEGKREVRRMSSSHGNHSIEYKDGRKVRLVEVDAPKPAEPATEEPAELDVHVVSFNGGKVHTLMPGMEENPYPLCRGGGMNQQLTKFQTTTAPLSCSHCVEYARRRAANKRAQ